MKKLQCKHIPTLPILKLMANEPGHWWYRWNQGSWSIQRAFPVGTPEKLVKAKMDGLILKGLVSGCRCGCRGDYELTTRGHERIIQLETQP